METVTQSVLGILISLVMSGCVVSGADHVEIPEELVAGYQQQHVIWDRTEPAAPDAVDKPLDWMERS